MLTLNFRDTAPIYGQIRDGLRRMIVTGAISADEKLPSVRSLAMDLAINPNTIQRAYGELEREGFIYSIPGKGSFAAPGQVGATRGGRSCCKNSGSFWRSCGICTSPTGS